MGVVVALTFCFGFGNVLALGLRLGVPMWIGPLAAPAVDLSVIGLLIGSQRLSVNGGPVEVLRAVRRLLLFASLVTLALSVAEPLIAGHYGRAAFDAVGPLLLIGWGEVALGLLQAMQTTVESPTGGAMSSRVHGCTGARPVPASAPHSAQHSDRPLARWCCTHTRCRDGGLGYWPQGLDVLPSSGRSNSMLPVRDWSVLILGPPSTRRREYFSMSAPPVNQPILDGRSLHLIDIVKFVKSPDRSAVLAESAIEKMRATVDLRNTLLAQGLPIYGVTTGFGDSCNNQISPDRAAELQRNLITYHLNGVGPIAEEEVVLATMIIRANCLAAGRSAIRPQVVQTLLRHVAAGIVPLVPERGSLGASGDLVPLCYVASALLGEGDVRYQGAVVPAASALAAEKISPVVLEPKEGLALINGTSFTTAFAVLAVSDAQELAFAAELATAMAYEALRGNTSHVHPFVHAAKPHPGQEKSASVVRTLLNGSALTLSYDEILMRLDPIAGRGHAVLDERIQDSYSLRCAPQVIGVLRDTLTWVEDWLQIEVNSATDNPLFDDLKGEVHHGGNFYAGHVGQAMDSLKTAVASTADLLDRQLARLVDERFNAGLPANLILPSADGEEQAGLHHGFKGMQIAASAITAEALKTAAPATVFSRSTEAHNQDKVSMGTIAARDARTIVSLTVRVAAIHLLALAQAVDIRGPERTAPALQRVHAAIRARVPLLDRDRRMDQDIEAVAGMIVNGVLRRAALGSPVNPQGAIALGVSTDPTRAVSETVSSL
ncbi:HAL/PAL/TAL family ammonia-lyase [Frankia sp. AgKG'84/4]|uniref:HAL/PAL/TAL family ammonia-lyase n=1 Tax=Frankia sp. AgKG'84/4 TaxID=573490 RepID=UPI0035B3C1AF